ncbi:MULTISPECIES: TetR/AcrR family transcriptional regulator [Cupriavidus]|uniref:TetR/AcrR family transcriptional regulator n=1 Tax=Cupriavidus metallidurans TaxID=119219 RepID=A0A482IP34_9BURK|nr:MULTISPECIES: TetR/AcrR family transcriptional regulator [Cupriavidus]QBP09951.1 TetR/AcrR family transcriptional regulator [Cupriavidus metallidurans]
MQQRAVKQAIPNYSEEAKPDMQPAPRRNREQRIREIIGAARQVFQEDGYAGFATRRVADRVGITHGNLQYYFRTNEELLRAALLTYVSQMMGDYTAIASRPGIGAAQRCTTLINRIFQNINETDLPKFMVEIWAFAWHETYVAELLNDMQTQFRGLFAKLLSELHPTLTSEECQVRAAVIGAQMDGMAMVASHGEYPGRDYIEFVRLTKRAVKMVVSASAQMLEGEAPLRRSRTRDAHVSSDPQIDGLRSDGYLQPGLPDLRARQSTEDAIYYRPTAQGKRREIKINEIISTAANLLATEGYANFTLARVARELGILPSALQNYFPTYDDLVRTTVGALGQAFMDRYAEIGKPSGKPALTRVCEIAAQCFKESCDPMVYRLWSEMFALAQHSDTTREVVASSYATYPRIYVDLIREIDPSATARECLARSTLITALVDGATVLKFGAQNQPVSVDRVFELMMAMTARIAQGRVATSNVA